MMKQVGVVLAGCGFMDGAEIYESVLTLLALDRRDIPYQCLAPDIPQMHVVNHLSGKPTDEKRSVLIESARLARGNIQPLDNSWIDRLDAVIFPGGFGAAKNYCDYAIKGDACSMNPIVESFILRCVEVRKPIGVICIAPLILARALKGTSIHPTLTAGAKSNAAYSIESFGSKHQTCSVTDIIVDDEYKIVSTPAYMYNTRIADVAKGIDELVNQVVAFIEETNQV
jgi:enhancing lycopene biosynthesis protein 2